MAGSLPRPDSAEHALATLIALGSLPGPEAEVIQKLLRDVSEATSISERNVTLQELGPLALASLEHLLDEIVQGRCSLQAVQKATGKKAS